MSKSGEGDPLSIEAFEAMAERLEVDRDIREELYPMVRDLLAFAGALNSLAPELGTEMQLSASMRPVEGKGQ